jgi:ferredoxin
MAERLTLDQEVAGSRPASPAIYTQWRCGSCGEDAVATRQTSKCHGIGKCLLVRPSGAGEPPSHHGRLTEPGIVPAC